MKLVKAENQNGDIVTGDGVEVPDVQTDLALERDSKGFLLVDENGAQYVAFPVEDVAELVEVCGKLNDLSELLSNVPAVLGQTPAAGNPQIPQSIIQIRQQLTEFKKT